MVSFFNSLFRSFSSDAARRASLASLLDLVRFFSFSFNMASANEW